MFACETSVATLRNLNIHALGFEVGDLVQCRCEGCDQKDIGVVLSNVVNNSFSMQQGLFHHSVMVLWQN